MLKGQQHKIFTRTIFRNLTLLAPPIYLMKHFENGFVFVDMFVVNVRKIRLRGIGHIASQNYRTLKTL